MNTVESSSRGKSSGDSWRVLLISKQALGFSIGIYLMMFGFCPNTFSNGLLYWLPRPAVRRANRRRVNPKFLLGLSLIFLMRSYIVRIRCSFFPFPRGSRYGHSMSFMKHSSQNCLNFSPRNVITGSVRILFEMLCCAVPSSNAIATSRASFVVAFSSVQRFYWTA